MKRILFTYVLLCLAGSLGVVMGQVPVVSISPTFVHACVGNNVTLIATASNAPTNYIWQHQAGGTWATLTDDATYSGCTTTSLTIHTNSAMAMLYDEYYQCVAVNAAGPSLPSPEADLWFNSGLPNAPSEIITGQTTIVCAGTNDIPFGSYPHNPTDTCMWSYTGNGITIVKQNPLDSSITLNFNPTASSGNLSLYFKNVCGTGPAISIPITVNPLQATPAATAGGSSICTSYTVLPVGTTYTDPATCSPITSLAPSGANPVSGTIQSCVTVDASVQSYGGIPYVQRHYNLEPSTNPGTSTATVTLYFTQADFDAYNLAKGSSPALPTGSADATGIANLRVTQFHGTGTDPGTYVGGSGEINPDDNNIVWNTSANRWEVTFDITGFSGFFVSGGSITPLPLTLIGFTGQSVTNGNLLQWTTVAEENTRSFEIQRNEGNGFQSLATIPAAGNSHQTLNYSYTDPLDGSAAYSYRLKMIDVDGKFTYSKTVTMQTSLTALSIGVSPNPFHQAVALTVSSPKPANAMVTVTDISGKLLLQQNISLAKGENSLDPGRIAALPQGVYLLSVTTDQQKQTVKFIKE